MGAFALLFVTLVVVVVARARLVVRVTPRRHVESFEGRVYAVGRSAIAERRCERPRATVIAVHGFLEDMRYFTTHYAESDLQLVLVTSADYHVPFGSPPYETPAWANAPTADPGTIAYDAQVLVQALEHLPRSEVIRVHGHSRGGAVILEAAALRPELFADVEVVLEAPVLPQGRTSIEVPAVGRWMLPFVAALWKLQPLTPLATRAYGALADERKRSLLAAMPFHPKTAAIVDVNLADLATWMRSRDASLYENVRGVVLVPRRDRVLRPAEMLASARAADGRLEVVELEDASHFVLHDRPDTVPVLPALRRIA